MTRTTWPARDPYALETLAQVIPFGWRVPKPAVTGVGRNVDMFLALMTWAGRIEHREIPVFTAAEAMQAEFVAGGRGRLPISEVRATAASVERYRARWDAQGWHKPAWIERQAARGRKSGAARRAAVAGRDAAIAQAVAKGEAMRAVARRYGLADGTVRNIMDRMRNEPTQIVHPTRVQAASQRHA